MRIWLTIVLIGFTVAACGNETTIAANGATNVDSNAAANAAVNNGANATVNNGANVSTNNGGVNNASTAVTYHKDVRPILEANCTGCHLAGGIGPFPLTTYEQVKPLAQLVSMTVEAGNMPPWPPADDCMDIRNTKILTAEEVFTIKEWTEEGTPEGDPASYVAPEVAEGVTLEGSPDFVVDIGTDYVPNPEEGSVDDYHCFVVDPEFAEDKFMNAYQTHPGNPQSVHHMLYWAIPKSTDNMNRIAELEALSPDVPGYTCFGSNRVDESGLLGAWVPGTGAIQLEPGHGFRVPANHVIVVQIHYNTINSTRSDRTTIDLYFNEDGETSQVLGMYPFPDSDLDIRAGDSNAKEGTSFTLPLSVDVYGLFPHMHQLGTRIRVSATYRDTEQCLVDIPDWDFNWQGLYFFEEPFTVRSTSTLNIDCWYDNSAANQPSGQTPRDVEWGEGTYDEMCLNYFITEELPFL
jgi:hypothetical protein